MTETPLRGLGQSAVTELRLIAETPRWIVVDKPAGWLSIPGRDPQGPPVVSEWLKGKFGEIWVVHRLDRETSGVLLFARTPEAHQEANGWFQSHRVKKGYDCLALGIAPAPMFKIHRPISEAPSSTQVEVRERFAGSGVFLARANPLTGRRHQIRIHLSGEGYPLLGDKDYQGPEALELSGQRLPIGRVALHAARLELPSKEVFESPWPPDFTAWVESLRAAR